MSSLAHCVAPSGWHGVGGQIGAGQVGVAGEGGALLAVDQEAHLGDAGQVGVQGAADGEHGERFGLDAGGVAGGESAGEVDDGEFGARLCGRFSTAEVLVAPERQRAGGQQEDLGTEAAPPGTGWAASGAA